MEKEDILQSIVLKGLPTFGTLKLNRDAAWCSKRQPGGGVGTEKLQASSAVMAEAAAIREALNG